MGIVRSLRHMTGCGILITDIEREGKAQICRSFLDVCYKLAYEEIIEIGVNPFSHDKRVG